MQPFLLKKSKQDIPEGIMTKCPNCKKIMYTKELNKNLKVCLHCDYHYPMTAWERIQSFIDEDSFEEINAGHGVRQSSKISRI